jgi:adenine-specific DNA methylase
MEDKTRLIEVAFPMKQASVASVHEKNVRHGHISTLHIWPARRPLAACRAALLATLLPDPGDPVKRQELLDQIGGAVVMKNVKSTDDDGVSLTEEKESIEGGVLAWGQESSQDMDAFRKMILEAYGGKAPKVLDPFAGGGAIPLEAMRLGCDVSASDINPVAWFILKCTLEYPSRFAGKKWPLPEFVKEWPDFIEDLHAGKIKKRKGNATRPFFDPSQPQLFNRRDADQAWHVRAWGRWVLERARADLAARYPVINGEPTVAYLWARTARDKMAPYGRIPLLKTFWLCKKSGRRSALMPIPKEDGTGVDFKLLDEDFFAGGIKKIKEQYPHLQSWDVTAENLNDFLNKGTMNRAGVWSPCTGRPGLIALTMDDLRRQGQQGLLGTQMTAVVVETVKPGKKTTCKKYRLPEERELKAAEVEIEDLEEVFKDIPFGIPDEPTPIGGGSGASRAFSLHRYGIKNWSAMFTPRQLLALGIFIKHTRMAISEIAGIKQDNVDKEAEAVGSYLSLVFDRLADYSSAFCTWHNTAQKMRNTFGRFALPMVWDFTEVSPVSNTTGNYRGALEWVARYIGHGLEACLHNAKVSVNTQSATIPINKEVDIVLTDPPYYDAIPYSDLMDFFYVWLRRNLSGVSSMIDNTIHEGLTPKWNHTLQDGELIDDESRFGGDKAASKKAYEDGMAKSFKSSFNSLEKNGRLVVVFANKEVVAWETLIAALIRGGAVVTASWPIETEMPTRTRSMSSAALASSVWIVCRKREKFAQPGWEETVLDDMRKKLFDPREALGNKNILQYYFDLGIRGPDFIWAALGPALEAYSAHPYVKKTEGGMMEASEFLKEVRRLVLQFSLGELPGFRDIQQTTQGRGEGIDLDPVTQYYLLHRAYFGLDPAPAGACILYANACGKNETELKMVWHIIEQGGKSKKGRPSATDAGMEDGESESKGNEYRLLAWRERVGRDDLGEPRGGLTPPLIDRLHRLMYLFDKNRAVEVQQLFDAWGLASEKAFAPLLQAVRELALRDKDDTEKRIAEALATQLKVTKRTVLENLTVTADMRYEEQEASTAKNMDMK